MQLDVNLNILILNFAVVQKAVKLNFAPRNTNQIQILYNEFKCYWLDSRDRISGHLRPMVQTEQYLYK